MGTFDKNSTAEQVTDGLDLTGRTALVTGATSGIGFETARVLALRGAHVLVAGRTIEKAREACARFAGRVTPLACELEEPGRVADCAHRVSKLGVPLDTLICNAGIMAPPRLELVRGVEKQFLVNHLGHFLLLRHLLPAVEAAPAGRVVMLSSSAHKWAPPGGIAFDNLGGDKGYEPRVFYGQSKLANALIARELSKRFAGTAATANAAHPGLIITNIIRYIPAWQRMMAPVVGVMLRSRIKTIAQGAATTCYLAAHPDVAGITGRYFADCAPATPAPVMADDALAARLWQESERLTREWH